MIGKVLRGTERPRGCSTTCTGREKRTSTPIRTWSPGSVIRPSWNRNADPTDHGTSAAWPGCSPSRWPRSTGRTTPSRSGTARCAPRPRTGCSRTRSGRRSPPGSCTGPGSPRRAMIWRCAGWRSGTPRTTSTWWRPWPARTAFARRSGTTSTGSGRPASDAERRFGLRSTAPADRTAARRPTRAETEQAARRGWAEPPRVRLRREVCTAAAGARTEQEFFTRLAQAGVLVRERYSTVNPGRGHRATRSACPSTPARMARRSGTAAGSSPPT